MKQLGWLGVAMAVGLLPLGSAAQSPAAAAPRKAAAPAAAPGPASAQAASSTPTTQPAAASTDAPAGSAKPSDATSAALDAKAEAIRLGGEGDGYWEQGRCDRAIRKWEEAEAHYHTPTLIFRIARCQAVMGKVVAATSGFEAIVTEEVKTPTPTSWLEAREAARQWLSGVKPRIARFTLALAPPPEGVALEAQLDGKALGPGSALPQDPGTHQLTVTARNAGSTDSWNYPLALDDGQARALGARVDLVLPPPPSRFAQRLGIGLLAGGTVVTGIGAGFGISALALSNSLSGKDAINRCSDTFVCPTTQQATISALRRNALVADVGVGVGLAAAVAGGLVLILSPPPKELGPQVKVVPLLDGAAVVGAF